MPSGLGRASGNCCGGIGRREDASSSQGLVTIAFGVMRRKVTFLTFLFREDARMLVGIPTSSTLVLARPNRLKFLKLTPRAILSVPSLLYSGTMTSSVIRRRKTSIPPCDAHATCSFKVAVQELFLRRSGRSALNRAICPWSFQHESANRTVRVGKIEVYIGRTFGLLSL